MDSRHALFELWRGGAGVLAVPLVALALLTPSWRLLVLSAVVGLVWVGVASAVTAAPDRADAHLSRWGAGAAAVVSIATARFLLGGWAALLAAAVGLAGVLLWARRHGLDAPLPD